MRFADLKKEFTAVQAQMTEHRKAFNEAEKLSTKIKETASRKYLLGENVVLVYSVDNGIKLLSNEAYGFFTASTPLKFTAAVLSKAAEITSMIEQWAAGQLDELPPSTWDKNVYPQVG